MTNKENTLRIIKYNKPERVMGSIPSYGLQYLGANFEDYDGFCDYNLKVGDKWTDTFGIVWHKEQEGVMGLPCFNPISCPADLKSYKWPDPDDERICGKIYERYERFPGGDLFLAGDHRSTLWEKAYFLVGMENLMIYFYEEPEFVREVLHKIMDFNIGIAKHYIKCGIELAALCDDLGTQRGLLFSIEIFRKYFAPEYKRLIQLYKEHGVLINFHSCGHIEPILEDLIELGIDIINPVQASANNLENLSSIAHRRIALMGGISSALVMDGPINKIEEQVRSTIQLLGKDGGYFCTVDQGLPFPEENLNALYKAVETYGKYPIEY